MTFTEIAVILSVLALLTLGKPVLVFIADWILGEL